MNEGPWIEIRGVEIRIGGVPSNLRAARLSWVSRSARRMRWKEHRAGRSSSSCIEAFATITTRCRLYVALTRQTKLIVRVIPPIIAIAFSVLLLLLPTVFICALPKEGLSKAT